MDLPYTKKQSADPPRGEGADPGSGWERAAARPAEAPAGPWHDFFLLQEGLEPYAEDSKWYGRRGTVRLSDDIISYLYDSLEWIPSLNPSNPEEWQGHGLNRWGSTVINREGASTALRVFSAWAELFAAGPAQLVLHGLYFEGPDDEKGYEKLLVPRDELVEQMQTLADYARRSVDGEGYILHLGV